MAKYHRGHDNLTTRNSPRPTKEVCKDPLNLTKIMRDQIAQARVSQGYTIAEMAQASGMGEGTWEMMENGARNVGIDKLVRACISLGIDFIKIR